MVFPGKSKTGKRKTNYSTVQEERGITEGYGNRGGGRRADPDGVSRISKCEPKPEDRGPRTATRKTKTFRQNHGRQNHFFIFTVLTIPICQVICYAEHIYDNGEKIYNKNYMTATK